VKRYGFEYRSELAAAPETVWAHATTMAGVNREFFPFFRMTHPRGFDSIAPRDPEGVAAVLGRRLFRSWILVAMVLPIDYDDLTLVEYEPGRRFLERSPMLTQREWEHERIVEPQPGGGCALTDRVRFVPRIAALGPLVEPVYSLVFRFRHRNLRRLFGAAAA
jgi:ligand-binding SRPBCC domain-containing protein